MDDCIVFGRIATANGQAFGRATLNAPANLNALSLAMVDRLAPQLDAWARDAGIAGVVLDGAGDKAFCAGGDVVALYRSIRAHQADPASRVPGDAAAFFEREYRLDYQIHTYPKPLLCWGHGIVMGGGVGLLAGASHRVATPRTRLAMPEIGLGLYPDVGGSWFLGRMPGRTGMFLALTGAPLNAADARFAGLADFVLRHEDLGTVLESIAAARWRGERAADAAQLSHLLAMRAAESPPVHAASQLRMHFDRIETLIGRDGLADIAPRLATLVDDGDPWLAQAGTGFVRGSPTSAALAFTLQHRATHLSLADAFRLEYLASVGCSVHHDFAEGVRALLIEKDKCPRWQRSSLAAVDEALVEAHLSPRFDGPHPLADLR